VLNLKLEILSDWKYSIKPLSYFRGLKIDGDLLYLTMYNSHQIFLYKRQDGKLLKLWGRKDASSKQGEFKSPRGLTADNKYVYICDWDNHRIQLLHKDGIFYTQWGKGVKSTQIGQFSFPFSIFNDFLEDTVYIGDQVSVQLIRKGVCIQRLGSEERGSDMNQFNEVYGIYVMDNQLYVSDYANRRIQIFRRK